MSMSERIGTCSSRPAPWGRCAPLSLPKRLRSSSFTRALPNTLSSSAVQECQAFLEVQSRRHAFEIQAKLHHREGNFRLNAYNHGFCTTQANHVGQVAKSSRRE